MIASNILIFGFPRSGTKLLANIFEQQGYFNFGEFFDTFSSEIETTFPKAIRISPARQFEISKRYDNNVLEELHLHSSELKKRIPRFLACVNNFQYTTLTVHSPTFDLAPELFEIFRDRHILCTRRKNKFEQLISRSLTARFKNYNGEYPSETVKLDLIPFEKFYFQLHKAEQTQDFLISTGKGSLVDFDQLISGTLDLGFNYNVNSTDQHTSPESLIKNYDEMLDKFNQLNFKYPFK
jgi:hypothetical protein